MTSRFFLTSELVAEANRIGEPLVHFDYATVASGRLQCAQPQSFFNSAWTSDLKQAHDVKVIAVIQPQN